MTISPWRLNTAIALVASVLTASTASAVYSLFTGGPWSTRTWIIVVMIVLTALPVIALLQGIFALLHYRLFYINSPVPKTPSHGVVLAPEDQRGSTSNSCSCCTPPQQQQGSINTTASDSLDPIRLLVIGDSLAIGVGQSRSCCPVLPETIAKSLCHYFGGRRPVFWSCHGEPGASAGWVVRELQQRLPQQEVATSKSIMLQRAFSTAGTIVTTTDESCSETTSTTTSSDSSADDVDDDEDSRNESETYGSVAFDMPCNKSSTDDSHEMKDEKYWKQQLAEHSCCLESNPLDGHYDIVVVMTGSNDLKSAIFPFLLTGDDVEFRKQARERGGSYMRELCRVLQVIQPRLRKQHSCASKFSNGTRSAPCPRLPLVVLPGMPAEALPIFRPYPLHWAAVPFVDCMDRQKQKLAASRPQEVLFIPPPTLNDIIQFEAQCDHVLPEADEFLKLRNVTASECESIRDTMDSFYHSAAANKNDTPCSKLPLSERSGQPGTKIFSIDRIHPNDDGYCFWGKFIADAIVQEWDKRK